jgi:hypothetical protein
MPRFVLTAVFGFLLIVFVVSFANAQLPPCDYSQTVRVGSTYFDICTWYKADSEGVGVLQIAAVTDDKIVDLAEFDIFGAVSDVGVSDLDADTDPEVHIVVESPDSSHYFELYLLELANDQLDSYSLPDMNRLLANGYMGHDTISFEGDHLIRSFPIYDSNSRNARPTGGTRRLTYVLSENHLTLQSRVDTSPEPAPDSTGR